MSRSVTNQAAPIPDHDAWSIDVSARWWLRDQLAALGVGAAAIAEHESGRLAQIGGEVGSTSLRALADRANRNEPKLRTWDRYGSRIDDVEFDPSWHELLGAMTGSGVCGMPWTLPQGGYLVRAAAMELWGRIDIGAMCPVTMTSAAVPVLQRDVGGAGADLAHRILAASRSRELAHPLMGMAMTEPQGGSDVSATSTVAADRGDGSFSLDGHKWFCSHPVADGVLTLAREPDLGEGTRGVSCFLVPGWRGGRRNGIELQRLKDKLGTRSLASGEIVLRSAHATRIGEPGRGVPTIIEMVNHTRMDCALGSAGVLARAVGEAVNHARGRQVFGCALVDQPLMRMVLADLLLEREAALALGFEVARGFQTAEPLARLVTAVAKYWITRRAVLGCIECVEVLGGNGYTEEFPVARLYRDAQVNSTWEGSGNVIALDVLRAVTTDPASLDALHSRIGTLIDAAPDELASPIQQFAQSIEIPVGQAQARRFAGRLALALQAALLAHRAAATADASDAVVARAFIVTRLTGTCERVFGDGDEHLAAAAEPLLARAVALSAE